MNEQELKELQRKIGRITKENTDESVVEKLDKIVNSAEIDPDVFGKLLLPVCANCNVYALKYMLGKGHRISNAEELIEHTVRFRNNSEELALNQVEILEMLFAYVDPKDKVKTANKALVHAVWFGEFYAVRYLIDKQNADTEYTHNGKTLIELSENAVEKFGEVRVKEYLLAPETKRGNSENSDSGNPIKGFFKKVFGNR